MPKLENIDIAVSLKNVVMGEVDMKREEGDICYISQRRVFRKAKEGSYGYNLF